MEDKIAYNYNKNNIKLSFADKHISLLLPVVFLCSDYLAIILSETLAFCLRKTVIPISFAGSDIPAVYLYLIIPLIFLSFLHFDRMHVRQIPFWQMTEKIFKANTYAIVTIIVLLYFTGVAREVSRIYVFLVWLLSFSFLVLIRYIIKKLLSQFGLLQVPIVMIGAGKTAELLMKSFSDDPGLGYKVLGIIEDEPEKSPLRHPFPVLGSFNEAVSIIHHLGIQSVVIAAPGLERKRLLQLIYSIQPYVKTISFVPDLIGLPSSGVEVQSMFNEKVVLLRVRNNLARTHNRVAKTVFDMIFSLVGLVFILPILLIIGILIYLDSPGPVIFAHNRVGQGGREFPCYKYRTMKMEAEKLLVQYLQDNPEAREEWEQDFKLKEDPRITKIGKFLRKTSLDELPQLLNVLRGEMSLVGPRPIVKAEVERYESYIHDFYLVRPGITGLWQVNGRSNTTYEERVQMDSWYVRNWSVWLDIVLLLRTVGTVIRGKGAY